MTQSLFKKGRREGRQVCALVIVAGGALVADVFCSDEIARKLIGGAVEDDRMGWGSRQNPGRI